MSRKRQNDMDIIIGGFILFIIILIVYGIVELIKAVPFYIWIILIICTVAVIVYKCKQDKKKKKKKKIEYSPTYKSNYNKSRKSVKSKSDNIDSSLYNFSEECLVRFKNIIRAVKLIAHNNEELALIPLIGSQIIAAYSETEGLFQEFARKKCEEASDEIDTHNTVRFIIDSICNGQKDDEIIACLQSFYNIPSNDEEHSVVNHRDSQQPANADSSQPGADRYSSDEAASSVLRKHRAMQYANVIASGLLDDFDNTSDSDFFDYALSRCREMRTNNCGYILQLGKIKTESSSSQKPFSDRNPIQVTTDKISAKANNDDPNIQDFLDIANAITTMRLAHHKEQLKGSKSSGTKSVNKSNDRLYNDLVVAEFNPLHTKDPRFDITFRLLCIALERLKKGIPKEDIIDEIRRYEIRDNLSKRKNTRSQSSNISPNNLSTIVYSKEETRLLNLIRRILVPLGHNLIGLSSLEDALLRLYFEYSKYANGKISNYKNILIKRISVSSEYKVILEVILLIEQGRRDDTIVRIFTEIFSDHILLSDYKSKQNTIKSITVSDKLDINNDSWFLTWDECIEFIKEEFKAQGQNSQYVRKILLSEDFIDIKIIQVQFPKRFDSKGQICKLIKINEAEREIFAGYEIMKPNVSLFAYIPLEKFTVSEVFNLLAKAIKETGKDS